MPALSGFFFVQNTTMKSKLTLRGDRNQCPTCGLYFNSSHAFDKHRIGSHGVDRKCLTVPEMESKGMTTNKAGFWISCPHPGINLQDHYSDLEASETGEPRQPYSPT